MIQKQAMCSPQTASSSPIQSILMEDIITNFEGMERHCHSEDTDTDFDVKFNLPKAIRGKFYANVPFGMSFSDVSVSMYVVIKIRKVDTTGETELESFQSDTTTFTGSTTFSTFLTTFTIFLSSGYLYFSGNRPNFEILADSYN